MQFTSFTRKSAGFMGAVALTALCRGRRHQRFHGAEFRDCRAAASRNKPVQMPSFAECPSSGSARLSFRCVSRSPQPKRRPAQTPRGGPDQRGGPGQQFGMPESSIRTTRSTSSFAASRNSASGPARAASSPPPPQPPPRRASQGSGFFISGDGYVRHQSSCRARRPKTVEVMLDDGSTFAAEVVGNDPRTDLALLKIDAPDEDFPYVETCRRAAAASVTGLLRIGNPFGLGGTVTAGIISAEARDIGAGPYDEFLQIDAPINRGNSGGPTFNLAGEVVGVNTAIFSPIGRQCRHRLRHSGSCHERRRDGADGTG